MTGRTIPPVLPAPSQAATPQRNYPQLVTASPTEMQQVLNQAFDGIYQIGGPPPPQLFNMWFIDSGASTDNIAVGTDLGNHVDVRLPEGYALEFFGVSGVLTVAPVGSAAIYDILRAIDNVNWSSIFPASITSKIVFPDGNFRGSAGGYVGPSKTFLVRDGDVFRLDCLQVGSGTPGRSAYINMLAVLKRI